MGKLIRKILGNVAGAVGAIAFSDWNGQTVIKAKSEGSKSAPTPAQLFVREKFKVMTLFTRVKFQFVGNCVKREIRRYGDKKNLKRYLVANRTIQRNVANGRLFLLSEENNNPPSKKRMTL